MKIVYVVDCITDLTNKINLLTNRLGNNIVYVVRADLVDLFKTYGYLPNAIYYKNLTEVAHSLLLKSEMEDVVICYASLKFNSALLNRFTNAIGNKSQIVCLMPKYNYFEQMCNSTYNIYVKSLFKTNDSLVSNKLQFIPTAYMVDFLDSHLGNRLFENPNYTPKCIMFDEDKEINNSMKTKSYSFKFDLISLIFALIITIGLLASIAYLKVKYLAILGCIILYVLDLTLTIIFHCKSKFDHRFLK